jgi:hypothetical protein
VTLWLIKPSGGSDFAFRLDGVSERTTDVNPIAYQRDRMAKLVAEGITTFKVKARIMPYWVVQTITGPQEKGAPYYYPNETVPRLAID